MSWMKNYRVSTAPLEQNSYEVRGRSTHFVINFVGVLCRLQLATILKSSSIS